MFMPGADDYGSDYGSDDSGSGSDEHAGPKEGKKKNAEKEAADKALIDEALQGSQGKSINSFNFSYNADEESKTEVDDANLTKVQAHFNLFGPDYEDLLFEAKNMYNHLKLKPTEYHEEMGGERLVYFKLEFDLKPGAAEVLSPELKALSECELLFKSFIKLEKKHGIKFNHGFNFTEGHGEVIVLLQMAKSSKVKPFLPYMHSMAIQALENYRNGLFVDVEIQDSIKNMLLGDKIVSDILKTPIKAKMQLEIEKCLSKLLQVDENFKGFMKVVGFLLHSVKIHGDAQIMFNDFKNVFNEKLMQKEPYI